MSSSETSLKEAVLQALRGVQDPDLGRDIVSLGFVKDVAECGGTVSLTIELTTPACPVKDQMKEEARRLIAALPGVKSVNISMTARVRSTGPSGANPIPGVKNVVPVASGKGGVGKSTVSANLALALAHTGARVGLLDADVYGPSIPHIMGVTDAPEYDGQKMLPPERHGVKVMSMGFFVKPEEAVIWRGPMLGKVVDQFLGDVTWGDLDYLIIDLPPGTGDVQLSLCQKIPLTGAAIVSTPQDVALRIAEKAIFMFRQLNCPILGFIENMSYHLCSHCGGREEIFGTGGARRAAVRLGIPFLGEIPLSTEVRIDSDAGAPTVVSAPGSPQAEAFLRVAENLAAQISIRGVTGELEHDVKVTF